MHKPKVRANYTKVPKNFALVLTCFVDAAYAPSWSAKGRSITSILIYLGATLIICDVKAQSVVAQSSTEAEIIALAAAFKKIHYIQDFLEELGYKISIIIYEDNNGAITNAQGMQMNETVKHLSLIHI